jgi:DNA-binding XRE family transcriptional regulator
MPTVIPDDSIGLLLMTARSTLGLTQEQLGALLGVSRRTSGRWERRQSIPAPHNLHALARAVHPHDPPLASRIAAEAGATLASLGLESPPPPPAPAPPPPRPYPPVALLVESVVCAAAEALDAKPPAVRQVLQAAFHRARAMALSVEDIDDVLTPPPAAAPSRAAKAAAKGKD